ncbi:MAG: MFS transporter, partial [Gammaproteobacteria bacterium]|nr:MFS transporter [Gammaproteobacteria bacterium]
YGMLSDKYGRKLMITLGLVIFALGSLLAAGSESIYGIIIGRALQGSGAIAATLMALAADLSREEHRLKMMGFIGVSIGFSFALAMVLGPVLSSHIGVPGLFVFTAVMAVMAIVVLFTLVPDPENSIFHRDAQAVPTEFRDVLADHQLLRLNLGIFVLHLVLMASFMAIPPMLQGELGFDVAQHWKLYLPVFLVSVVLMVPFIILAEKRRRMKQVFIGAIGTLIIAELGLLIQPDTVFQVGLILVIFFTAFNLLEASLPSLVAKMAPADRKGTAMGLYSSGQFLGAFVGGGMGGFSYQHWGSEGVFIACAVAICVWLLAAVSMKNPRYLSTYLLNIGPIEPAQVNPMISELVSVRGVAGASIEAGAGIAYLKVELHALDEAKLLEFSINK